MASRVAALFVMADGPYAGLPDVDVWDESRDARLYAGPWPVVAHPPCSRWGRYWSGGPSARVRRLLGDDDGCFSAALAAVRRWGGVLEHPSASHAWRHHWLTRPLRGGWTWADFEGGWTCEVEQGHFGHRARKATWLYAARLPILPSLPWWPSAARVRCEEGFHSQAERRAARSAGQAPVERLSRHERLATPIKFRDLLLSMARSVGEDNGTDCVEHEADALLPAR